MIDVVARIKELMEKKYWTSYELSAQTGISTNAIYDWFKAGAVPSLGNILPPLRRHYRPWLYAWRHPRL